MNFISPQTLISEGDFLAFSLSCLGQSFTPFSFDINHLLPVRGSTQAKAPSAMDDIGLPKIKAEVIAPGMIVFTPVTVLKPDKPKQEIPQVILSCGIHGNETAPIEMCQAWIQKIILGEQGLAVRVLFIFGNLEAICAEKRFISHNLNTLFSGQHGVDKIDGTNQAQIHSTEKLRAWEIEHWVDWFFNGHQGSTSPVQESHTKLYHQCIYKRFHLDLHTAIRGSKYERFAISPYLNGRMPCEREREFLIAGGLECLLMAHAPTKAFTYFTTSVYQAVSYTLELGKVKPWGENDLGACADFIDEVSDLLAGNAGFLKSTQNTANRKSDEPLNHSKNVLPTFVMHREILRNTDNFTFNFADNIDNFTEFPIGYLLAKSGSEKINVETSQEAILFPNAEVAIGQRALLTVIPVE